MIEWRKLTAFKTLVLLLSYCQCRGGGTTVLHLVVAPHAGVAPLHAGMWHHPQPSSLSVIPFLFQLYRMS